MRTFRFSLGVAPLAAALALVAFTSTSSAASPTSMSEARALNDLAASAPSFSESTDGFVYKGKPVSAETIQARALACYTVEKGPSRCYDSPEELTAAELKPTAAVASKRGSRGPVARKAACGIFEVLWTWNGALGNGASTAWGETGRWANFGAAYNNEISSFAMGDRSGHLAENFAGDGSWYPGNTGVCAQEDNINRYLPSWNNRISSRYRTP